MKLQGMAAIVAVCWMGAMVALSPAQDCGCAEGAGNGQGWRGHWQQWKSNWYGGPTCARGITHADAESLWSGYCSEDCTLTGGCGSGCGTGSCGPFGGHAGRALGIRGGAGGGAACGGATGGTWSGAQGGCQQWGWGGCHCDQGCGNSCDRGGWGRFSRCDQGCDQGCDPGCESAKCGLGWSHRLAGRCGGGHSCDVCGTGNRCDAESGGWFGFNLQLHRHGSGCGLSQRLQGVGRNGHLFHSNGGCDQGCDVCESRGSLSGSGCGCESGSQPTPAVQPGNQNDTLQAPAEPQTQYPLQQNNFGYPNAFEANSNQPLNRHSWTGNDQPTANSWNSNSSNWNGSNSDGNWNWNQPNRGQSQPVGKSFFKSSSHSQAK